MIINKLKGGIIPTVTALTLSASCCITAFAYEAPRDIELSIGTVEINREDIHGDTIMEVPVFIQNNPGLLSVKMVFEADNGLRFDGYHAADSDNPEVASVNIYRCFGGDQAVSVNFTSLGTGKISADGQIGVLRLVVPEGIASGRYNIRFVNDYDDECMNVLSENSDNARFGMECFSRLEQGAVIVKDMNVPVPPSPPAEQAQTLQEHNDDPAQQQDQPSSPDGGETSSEVTETTVSSTSVTVTATTSTTSEKSTAASETTTETTDTSVTALESTSSDVFTTTTAETSSVKNGKGKWERNKVVIPSAIAAVIAAGTAAGFIARKKRGKNNE